MGKTIIKRIDRLKGNATLPQLDKQAIKDFLQENPSVDLVKMNTFHSKKLKALTWGTQKQEILLPQLKALQRLVRLTGDLEVAETLYEQGLHAAAQIAAIPQHKFVTQYAHVFKANGISAEKQAEKLHKKALARKAQVVHTYAALVQHNSAHYQATRFNNLSAATDKNYDSLPSYQELFGQANFCSCEECRSILSPAAYLVDLIRLQENYISKDVYANPPAQLLQDRRPDLWNLKLSCENTNTLVPKLQIVNEVLLNTLGKETTYEKLATTNYPFNLPFHLPLTQIALYLSYHKQTLAGISELLNITLNKAVLAPQSLNLSPEQWNLYSTPQTDPKLLAPLYGLSATEDVADKLSNIDTFIAQTGLSYTQLQELIYEDLSDEEIKDNTKKFSSEFFINKDTSASESISIDSDKNQLNNLNPERLDRINRFVRLAQALDWSFTDLDWVLRTVGTIINNGVPIINDAALPYLAWIQSLHKAYKLSINQCCTFLGNLKDFGQKNGVTFFDQIFNSQYIPNPPQWKNEAGEYDLVWDLSKKNNPELATQDPAIQIENALAAALQISQDDLWRIASLMLKASAVSDSSLKLTLSNLSILYRLSQLPKLTGLTIPACFVALNLPGQPKNALLDLTNSANDKARDSILLLENFAKWLKTTPFSVYQLQFILTGNSEDATIQNQALGVDKISKFLLTLQESIQPDFLTEAGFVTVLKPIIQNIFGNSHEGLEENIYSQLQEEAINYINTHGIVTALGEQASIGQLKEFLKDIIPSLPEEALNTMLQTISNLLKNSYQQQQNVLTQQLSSLYNVLPSLVPALETWCGITLGDLQVNSNQESSKPFLYNKETLLQKLLTVTIQKTSKTSTLLTENPDTVKRLQLMQQYALLLTTLALSASEAQAMVNNPQWFGISYTSENSVSPTFQFTLANIQTLCQFKQLVKNLQDNENHLLSYFEIVTTDTTKSIDKLAAELSKLTKWNTEQITFLLNKWQSSKEYKTDNSDLPIYATVDGINKLKTYFDLAQQLTVDVVSLWKFVNNIDTIVQASTYKNYQQLADILWAGLQTKLKDQPDKLTKLQGILDEKKRNALVGLAIYQLRTQKSLPIYTPNDLYEYLLLDVETSGVTQVSYIKEAISAVQLYVYRCFNALEPGISVSSELSTWWPWLETYRSWQANREVFLYPENYIEPELRKDKTPPFIDLENDLKQRDLTQQDQVIGAFQKYMEAFDQVANLQIIGAAMRDHYAMNLMGDKNDPIKEACLIGCTSQQPCTYYYRLVSFSTNGEAYTAIKWAPWEKIELQINPVGPVSSVYAFGRWYIFWVEQQQISTKKSTDGETDLKIYTAKIQFSFLNFSQTWVAPQTLVEVSLPDTTKVPMDISKLGEADKLFWDRVYPVFFSSIDAIAVPYGDAANFKLYNLSDTISKEDIAMALRYTTAEPLKQNITSLEGKALTKDALYQYATDFGNKTLPANSTPTTFSTWFKIDKLPDSGKQMPLLGDQVTINSDGKLCLNGIETYSHISDQIKSNTAVSYARFQDKDYVAWLDTNKGIHYGIITSNGQIEKAISVDETDISNDNKVSLLVYNDKLYIFYIIPILVKGAYALCYSVLIDGALINDKPKRTIIYERMSNGVSVAVWNDKIYLSWQTQSDIYYGILDEVNKKVKDKKKLKEQSNFYPNLFTNNNKLYIFWLDTKNNINYGILNDTSVESKITLEEYSNCTPTLTVWNNKIYLVWATTDTVYYGVLNEKTIQNKNKLKILKYKNNPSWVNISDELFLSSSSDEDTNLQKMFEFKATDWNHLAIVSPTNNLNINTNFSIAYARFNGQDYIAWTDSKNQQLNYGILDENKNLYKRFETSIHSCNSPSLAVYNNNLYIAWVEPNANTPEVSHVFCSVLKEYKIQNPQNSSEIKNFSLITLIISDDKLSLTVSSGSEEFLYAILDEIGRVTSFRQVVKKQRRNCSNTISYNNQLYVAWIGDDNKLKYGKLLESTDVILEECSNSTPVLTVSNNQIYITWKGTDNRLNCGILDGKDKVINKQTFQSPINIEAFTWLDSSYLAWVSKETNTVKVLSKIACYLNGNEIGNLPISFLSESTIPLGINVKDVFTGSFQETVLLNKALTQEKIKVLYENSKLQITQDFQTTLSVKNAFGTNVISLPILSQPNSYLIQHENTEFLAWPFVTAASLQPQLACTRLNTTAVKALSETLLRWGIDDLLSVDAQLTPEVDFAILKPNETYIPKANWPSNSIDLMRGAMRPYYWEVFFHIPFLIARNLSTQQQFEQAKKWYAYIFDPTVNQKNWRLNAQEDANDKYWRFLGLRSLYNPVLYTELHESWQEEIQHDLTDPSQLYAYHMDPFDPHAIASMRPIAYQKALVMHYIDNLLSWSDNLFRKYTIETLVEATMLYVTAYDLLGKRPTNLGSCKLPAPETLAEIAKRYQDHVPEFLMELEQLHMQPIATNAIDTPHNSIPETHFSLPENEQFVTYWSKIKQRLYNIRHNLNIDGVYQQLPLFDPPINPMQLVQAIASGQSVQVALNGSQVDIPYYRFNVMIFKAQSLVQNVIQLGQSLLSVLEKQDAEKLSLLYNTNQQSLLALNRTSKADQLLSAQQNTLSLQASLKNAQDRLDHYKAVIEKGLLAGEVAQITLDGISIYYQTGAQVIKGASIAGYLTPTIFGMADGGLQPGDAIAQGAHMLEGSAQATSMAANLSATVANYQRRKEDWELQQTLAQDDVNQINYQILAAQYQEQIAQEEIKLLEKQIEQEQATEAFLKNKFTRVQLYQWMAGKLSTLYFQAYQLAYNVAMQAEKAWEFERCKKSSFINPIYWDNLYQGLVAGEALQLDLQRMEKAYMDQDERKLEVEKFISLAQLDPQAFQDLKSVGTCKFDLTEKDFDYDYPGHYCRQIKTISVSFPALIGPYQNVHASLTQTSNRTLLKSDTNGVKYLLGTEDGKQPDSNILRVDVRTNQQVALSQGINDNGLFVINFEDSRYLPFEGTGVISSWLLEMPKAYNTINFDSITDVIIRVQYTAIRGSSSFQKTVQDNLGTFGGYQSLLVAQRYASAWYGFLQQQQPLVFVVSPALFRSNLKNYKITGITLIALPTTGGEKISEMPTLTLSFDAKQNIDPQEFVLAKDSKTGTVSASISNLNLDASKAAEWKLSVKDDTGELMTAENVSNLIINLQYKANFS